MNRLRGLFGRRLFRWLGTAVVAALVAGGAVVLLSPGSKHGVAYFQEVKSVYPKDKVRILGIEVGTIDAIVPEPGRVRVEFSYDSKYTLPANVRAAIVSPTLVATRFIQLDPPYGGGPAFPDGGTIPVERTVTPLEFDDLKNQLTKISQSLGPNGLNKNGALSDFLNTAATAGQGQGKPFNDTVRALSSAMDTLANGSGDLFGTIRNLQQFVTALAGMDSQLSEFNNRLGGVSDLLSSNDDELATTLQSVQHAATLVQQFLATNRGPISQSASQLAELTHTLALQRDNLATLLHVGPNTLMNFYNIFSPRVQAFTGGLMVDNLDTPGQLACSLIANQLPTQAEGAAACQQYLGPLINMLKVQAPPVGTGGPLLMPGAGGPVPEREGGPPEPAELPTDGGKAQLPPQGSNLGLSQLLLPGGGS